MALGQKKAGGCYSPSQRPRNFEAALSPAFDPSRHISGRRAPIWGVISVWTLFQPLLLALTTPQQRLEVRRCYVETLRRRLPQPADGFHAARDRCLREVLPNERPQSFGDTTDDGCVNGTKHPKTKPLDVSRHHKAEELALGSSPARRSRTRSVRPSRREAWATLLHCYTFTSRSLTLG